ncbi:cdc42 homolog [Liolophura sinensis]|uniref:cdc42 homolog n=1 Tax=Liolophura sinensis TaxID=3198878 RepID=UPI00315817F2
MSLSLKSRRDSSSMSLKSRSDTSSLRSRSSKCAEPSSIKCVIVGDAAIGKTCLSSKFATGKYHSEYNPTTFDNFVVTLPGPSSSYVLSIFDTAGQESFDRLRVLSYVGCKVFIVCFSVVSPKSFKSVEANWIEEINHYMPRTPFILVGTRSDLRRAVRQRGAAVVSKEQGFQLADRIGAECYVECSALSGEGLRDVFVNAMEVALKSTSDISDEDSTCGCRCSIV